MLYMSPFTAATTLFPFTIALFAMLRTVCNPTDVPSHGITGRSSTSESGLSVSVV